jgi:hypothetical protein
MLMRQHLAYLLDYYGTVRELYFTKCSDTPEEITTTRLRNPMARLDHH